MDLISQSRSTEKKAIETKYQYQIPLKWEMKQKSTMGRKLIHICFDSNIHERIGHYNLKLFLFNLTLLRDALAGKIHRRKGHNLAIFVFNLTWYKQIQEVKNHSSLFKIHSWNGSIDLLEELVDISLLSKATVEHCNIHKYNIDSISSLVRWNELERIPTQS